MTKQMLPLVGVIFSSVFLAACTPQVAPPVPTNNEPTTTANEQTMKSSLREIVAKGGSVQCSFSYNDDTAKSQATGTIYASGNRFAEVSDVVITGVTTPQRMNVISDGTYLYSWGSDSKIPGVKMKLEVSPTPTTEGQTNQTAGLDQKMDMKCGSWTVDESKFTIPSDVTFTDVSTLMTGKTPTIPAKMPSNIPGY